MKKALIVASALALGGCAGMTPVQVDQNSANAFQGATLTTVTYKKPPFTATTYGRIVIGSVFGAVGGAVAAAKSISAGDQIVQENQIADPAEGMAAEVTPKIVARLKAASSVTLADQDPKDNTQLSAALGNKGVVLDVQTINWMFLYFPLDWTHYHVMYAARARLIDASNGKTIGLVPCNYDSGDDKMPPPNYDTLLADHAAILKAKLAAAASACTAKIEATMLGG
jgi:hypothetical protein